MDVESLERVIEAVIKEGKLKPRAMVVVDLFGLPADYDRILATLKKYQIYYIFINGGNGSVAAGHRLCEHLKKAGYPCCLMVIPKTVDNDIAIVDHAPGFP